ncbi:CHAT domain-containing protein [Streptomyces chartreusis]
MRNSVAASESDRSQQAEYLLNLARSLRSRFDYAGQPGDLVAAQATVERAARSADLTPSLRTLAARYASRWALPGDPARSAVWIGRAVRLLPDVVPRDLHQSDQQHFLGELAGLAADAAALAMDNPTYPPQERPGRALSLLEAGRAVLYGQVLETRSDLTDLAVSHPDLAARFVSLRNRLDRASSTAALGAGSGRTHNGDDRRALAGEFQELLRMVRSQAGFSSFAMPPSVESMLAQACEGPVVALNVSSYRCDALILTLSGVLGVPLHTLTSEQVSARANAYHRALSAAGDRELTASARASAQRQLGDLLAWLWDTIAEPVLDALGYDGPPEQGRPWPRVWWIPGGPLSLLPVHAAGHHARPAAQSRSVLERVVSSYTPTVRALRHSREHAARLPAVPLQELTALIVAMPTTPGTAQPLHFALDEAHTVLGVLPEAVFLTEPGVPPNRDASDGIPTRARVMAQLPESDIAHFACHGWTDPVDPSKSHLLLHDHATDPLTAACLTPTRLRQARLAYLSACATALSPVRTLLDESIHLAAAFQLAGYPHVIGTLWEIDDATAVEITRVLYTGLLHSHHVAATETAAVALHRAVLSVRERYPQTPSLWAAYLHMGI